MKNKFKIIFATTSALATTSPIVVLTGCSCNPEQQGDNTITVDEKNIELNDETIRTNLDPIATFDFSVADGIKVAKKDDFNIEILHQKHTGGLFKDFGDDFQYHTKIDFNSLIWTPSTNEGQFLVRFSEGILDKDSQVTFDVKVTYTDTDGKEHMDYVNGLSVTNELTIWEKVTPQKIDASSSKEQIFKIYCYGFSAGRTWDVALINGDNTKIEVGKASFTTSSIGGAGSENGYIEATTTFTDEFVTKYKDTGQKFYFACQPKEGSDYLTEPVYLVPYLLSF